MAAAKSATAALAALTLFCFIAAAWMAATWEGGAGDYDDSIPNQAFSGSSRGFGSNGNGATDTWTPSGGMTPSIPGVPTGGTSAAGGSEATSPSEEGGQISATSEEGGSSPNGFFNPQGNAWAPGSASGGSGTAPSAGGGASHAGGGIGGGGGAGGAGGGGGGGGARTGAQADAQKDENDGSTDQPFGNQQPSMPLLLASNDTKAPGGSSGDSGDGVQPSDPDSNTDEPSDGETGTGSDGGSPPKNSTAPGAGGDGNSGGSGSTGPGGSGPGDGDEPKGGDAPGLAAPSFTDGGDNDPDTGDDIPVPGGEAGRAAAARTATVPEPTMLVLAGSAAAGMFVRGWRRNRKNKADAEV